MLSVYECVHTWMWHVVSLHVFTAEADRSCNSDRMQATPTRPCMLTAAGREKEQLLMSFQYKEPTLSLAFYLSILLYLYVHLLFY